MQRLLGDTDEPVSVDVATGQIRFRFGDVELVSKLVEGKFPDFTRVIPNNYTRHFSVSRETLQGSLQRARSEEHTSELQSLMRISYAVFCLKKKKTTLYNIHTVQYKEKYTTI